MQAMLRRKITGVLIATAGAGLIFAGGMQTSFAEDDSAPKGFQTISVLKSSQTASGMELKYPPADTAEVVSVIVVLEPGGRTALHQHPVPVFAYVMEGTLTVKAEGGTPRHYHAGEAFLEDINVWHQGFNETGKPTRVLVVFMGEKGKPTTVMAK